MPLCRKPDPKSEMGPRSGRPWIMKLGLSKCDFQNPTGPSNKDDNDARNQKPIVIIVITSCFGGSSLDRI